MDDHAILERFQAMGRRLQAIEDQLVILSEKAGVPYAPPGDGVSAEVRALAAAGKKIDAIRVVRAELNLTLVEAKALVESL